MADTRRRDLAARVEHPHPHPHPLPPPNPHPHAQVGHHHAVPLQQHPHPHPPHAMQHLHHPPHPVQHHHAAEHIPRDRVHERPKPPQPLGTSNPGGRSGSSTKNLRCAFPGCGKLFTRKDHLIRHAANHSQPNFHCGTCGRSFQRLDLLQRHERRRICDDERYPKRMRTSAAPPKPNRLTPTTGPVDHASTSSSDSRGPSSSMPPPNRPSPRPVQSHHPSSLPHSGSSSSHAGHSHHSGADGVASSSFIDSFDPPGDTFPAHEMVLGASRPSTSPSLLHQLPNCAGGIGHNATGGVANSSGGFDIGAPAPILSGPIFLEPQQADFGFGLSTPDPWESLLHDAMAPAFWNESTAVPGQPSSSLHVDSPMQPGSALPQEGAERGAAGSGSGGGGRVPGPGSSDNGGGGSGDVIHVVDALLGRIQASYPDFGLTVPDFTEALDLYWSRVAPSFPFIHRGTFNVDTAAIELVVMMAVTGAVHSSSRPRRNDINLVRTLRANLIKASCGVDMPLSTLQAYTLCHVYDTWYGDTGTLFVAQCLWPVIVAHSRKVGIGAPGFSSPDGHGTDAWITWAKIEERRRAAYAILLIDTQISTFWSQHPSRQLSIFTHNISLPCPSEQWEARTAHDWMLACQAAITASGPNGSSRRPPTRQGFPPGLAPFLTESYSSSVLSTIPTDCPPPPARVDMNNIFAVSLVLTGLTAIAWDCRTRGGMGLRFRDGSKHWRTIVLDAVVNLRAQHEVATAHLAPSIERTDLRDSLAISIISILSDILMLQVAAGATNVCGAKVGPIQYADCRRRLRLWAPTQDAWTCLWQSSRYLREALVADWGLYTPWAVFLTTLVVWAYASAPLEDGQMLRPPCVENNSGSATALLDGIFGSPTRVDHLDGGVKDLVVIAARRLDAFGQPIHRVHAQVLWQLASDNSSTTAPHRRPSSTPYSSSVLPPPPGWQAPLSRNPTSIFPSVSQQRRT